MPIELPVGAVLNGLSLGVMLALAAVGLTLIFGFLGVVNFAHGAFYMVGGYVLFYFASSLGQFWLGILLAPLLVGLLGVLVERALLAPTYDLDPIKQMLILVGFSYIGEASVILIWGENAKGVGIPAVLGGQLGIFGFQYPLYRLFVIVVGVGAIVLVWALLSQTRIGLVVRASLVDKDMVRALGFNVALTYTFVFAFGVALAAIAGALIVPFRGISPLSGSSILLDSFIIVVIGGLGSFRGSIVAGIGVGFIITFTSRYISTRLSGLIIFILLVAVLVVRPRGLFGQPGVFEGE